MNDIESLSASTLSAYPVGTRPNSAIEEIVVKAEKQEKEGFTFFDFLDVVNPLQHIPIINTLYREMTGDEIKAPAKMIGSAILGGPVGLAVAMIDTVIEDSTGKDMGSHAMALFKGDEPAANSTTALAESSTSNASLTTGAGAPDTAQTVTTALASAVQVASAQTTSAREFIPALSVAAASARSLPASIIEDGTKDPVQQEADSRTQETQAAIAAASAAAPQGLVFMPLPGRQGAAFKPAAAGETGNRFMAVNRNGPASRPTTEPTNLAQLQAQTSFRPGPFGSPSGSSADQLNALLEATKPQGDTGRMPTADPFAAARMIGEENAPTVMPAWFEAATSGALDKYKAMQATP